MFARKSTMEMWPQNECHEGSSGDWKCYWQCPEMCVHSFQRIVPSLLVMSDSTSDTIKLTFYLFWNKKTFTICGATGITLSTLVPTKMTIMIAPGFELGGDAGISFLFLCLQHCGKSCVTLYNSDQITHILDRICCGLSSHHNHFCTEAVSVGPWK